MGPRPYFMPQASPSAGTGRPLKAPGKSGEFEGRRNMYSHTPPQERLANCQAPRKKWLPGGSHRQTEGNSVCLWAWHQREQKVPPPKGSRPGSQRVDKVEVVLSGSGDAVLHCLQRWPGIWTNEGILADVSVGGERQGLSCHYLEASSCS